MQIISKKDLIKIMDTLENGVDKFILAALYYGIGGSNQRKDLLNLTTDMVDFENSTITISTGQVYKMDSLLKKVTQEALLQKVYVKMGQISMHTNVDYSFNEASPYVIKTKPSKVTRNGFAPMSNEGFKNRIRSISNFATGDPSEITPSLLKKSGVLNFLFEQNKKLGIVESEMLLKENGMSLRRNALSEFLRYSNQRFV